MLLKLSVVLRIVEKTALHAACCPRGANARSTHGRIFDDNVAAVTSKNALHDGETQTCPT